MTKFSKFALCALLIASTASIISCSKDDNNSTPATPTLYQKLGGTTLVADPVNPGQMIEQGRLSYRSVVDSTITLIVADILTSAPGNLTEHFAPLVNEYATGNPAFATNVAELSDNLTDFFSFNTGGTNAVNTYSGLSMAAAHNPGDGSGDTSNPRMGRKANNANYDKFEGYVGAAANLNGVATGTDTYNSVVAVLESLRPTIVQTTAP